MTLFFCRIALSFPLKISLPVVGISNKFNSRNIVVFPTPLGPIKANISPVKILRLIFCNTFLFPKDLLKSSILYNSSNLIPPLEIVGQDIHREYKGDEDNTKSNRG